MIVGIDLGTTNSLVACYIDGKVEIIPNRLGRKLTPSVVAVDENQQILIGETAREYGYLHPEAVARNFKRTMGTNTEYDLSGLKFDSEELSSLVLRSLKEDAEAYLNQPVDEAIISVPAYFNDNQRKATKHAGQLAGLNVSRIINEPTASAIYYGVGDSGKTERCMVFDLGGGTLDVTILEYYKNIMEVYAIAGDNFLGGEDFTRVLMDMFQEKLMVPYSMLDLKTVNSIYKAAEACKIGFTSSRVSSMSVSISSHPVEFEFTIEEYADSCRQLFDRIRIPLEKSLHDAKVTLDDIDRIILVGGATKLSIIRDYVAKITGMTPEFKVDPDTSVACGAALQCAMKQRDKEISEIILTDVCPFTLGTEVIRNNGSFDEPGHYLPIIERNTVIPVSRKQTVYTAYDNQKYVTVKVLQGESRLAENNLLLGQLSIDVPVGPKGREAIEITYTYDVNALLEVEVEVLSTHLKKKVIIQNQENKLTEEEAAKKLERLQYLKQNPREDEENTLALLWANRMYEETLGPDRDKIVEKADAFNRAMNTSNRLEIEKARRELTQLLEELENQSFQSGLAA